MPQTGRVLALLRRSPELRHLLLAHSVSRAGDACSTVAMVVLVFRLTGSGLGVAGGLLLFAAAAVGLTTPLSRPARV